MNLKQAKQHLPVLFDAGVSVELRSSPGVGKSETIEQLVADLSARDGVEWGFQVLMLA